MKPSRKTKRSVVLTLEDSVPSGTARIPKTEAAPRTEIPVWLPFILGAFATFLAAFLVYSPSLNGQFVFDDLNQPFLNPNARGWPLKVWLGTRPLLMTTFWANLHLSNQSGTFAYHFVNVCLHATAAILLFLVLRRILGWTQCPRRDIFAIFGAAIFLLHPIQTEAVSYVTQRGEDMGACLYFAAFCLFLYRKPGPISWLTAIAVAALYGAAVITKEHTVTLPALLLLTDYFFNPGYSLQGIKRNWRLYSLLGAGFLMGISLAVYYLSGDTTSVGFKLPEFNGFQYLFTEFRVFFAYLMLFIYPLWQTIDYDFPVSKNLFDPVSLLALALILGLLYAAVRYRRRFPLASYGLLAFCLLLLPTSSVIPIRDPIVDRRLYLPMIGLILIVIELLRHWKISRGPLLAALGSVCVLMATGTYRRNEKWMSAVSLWADAAEKNPEKPRIQFGLAAAQFLNKQCHDSISHYERAIALSPPDYQLDMNLGLAYQCDNRPSEAIRALDKSIALKPSAAAWASLGLVHAQQGNMDKSLEALKQAEAIQPNYVMTFVYRGGIFQAAHRINEAAAEYRHALALEPGNEIAKSALAQIAR
jgi:tetratricopeptide (TPR) repeat protein